MERRLDNGDTKIRDSSVQESFVSGISTAAEKKRVDCDSDAGFDSANSSREVGSPGAACTSIGSETIKTEETLMKPKKAKKAKKVKATPKVLKKGKKK